MTEIEEIRAHVEVLESHVARLEGIIRVMLEELEAGSIQATAAAIREQMPRID